MMEETNTNLELNRLTGKPLEPGCSNNIPEYIGISCDDVGVYVLSTGTERVFDETIYNTADKGPDLVGQLVKEKIEHYHRIWPDWLYESVTYHKDNFGGMRCQFKFKRR